MPARGRLRLRHPSLFPIRRLPRPRLPRLTRAVSRAPHRRPPALAPTRDWSRARFPEEPNKRTPRLLEETRGSTYQRRLLGCPLRVRVAKWLAALRAAPAPLRVLGRKAACAHVGVPTPAAQARSRRSTDGGVWAVWHAAVSGELPAAGRFRPVRSGPTWAGTAGPRRPAWRRDGCRTSCWARHDRR